MGFLSGKRALVTGVISDRSIAYGIAESIFREGGELAFTCQNEALKDRVYEIVKKFNPVAVLPCDVSKDDEIANVFTTLEKNHWHDGIDIIIHSVAFAPRDQISGDFIDNVTREGFRIAHDISAYSFAALGKAGKKLLMQRKNSSLLTVSYLGAERVVQNYNTMGIAKASLQATMRYMAASLGPHDIRVNAISPGPIKTLAASGVKNFRKLLACNESLTPLRRNVTIHQVGDVAAFLSSDLASGITGELIHVDSGYHCVTPFSVNDDE